MGDTESIDKTVHALYETISGPAGVARDWKRFRSLFFPGARLVRTLISDDLIPRAFPMDVHEYETDTSDYFRREPFYEAEVAHKVDRFGNIAHVISVFEARRHPEDVEPIRRGINSIQLFYDGNRWWIISVIWDNEREGNRIPPLYFQC
jgi:hypothetical protein